VGVVPVSLARADVQRCLDFARAVRQSGLQFGSADTRPSSQRILDTFTGKLAEVALQSDLTRADIGVDLDFDLYDAATHDGGTDILAVTIARDRRVPARKVDIKAITGRSQWLLVESHKYGPEWAEVYVLVRLNATRPELMELCSGRVPLKSVGAEVVGWVDATDFLWADGFPIVCIRAGDQLPSTREELLRRRPSTAAEVERIRRAIPGMQKIGDPLSAPENLGFPISWLRRDTAELFRRLHAGGAST
jgi:hypothetical protein